MDTATCFKDRDNSFLLTLQKNGVTLTQVEMNAITKFEIKYNGAYYDSVDESTGFVRDNVNGTVQIKPYELGLAVSSDKVELIIYDATNTHGIMWDQFKLDIKGDVTV